MPYPQDQPPVRGYEVRRTAQEKARLFKRDVLTGALITGGICVPSGDPQGILGGALAGAFVGFLWNFFNDSDFDWVDVDKDGNPVQR